MTDYALIMPFQQPSDLTHTHSNMPCFIPFTAPDDFNTINQGLFFPSGTVPPELNAPSPNAQQCFFFSPTPDPCIEDQEDIIIELSSMNDDVQFTAAGNQAGIYINDDDSMWPCLVILRGGVDVRFKLG